MEQRPAPALVLLAAGLSRRYGRPKQLDPVGPTGAALPAYTMADALAAGFAFVVVVTRPELRDAQAAHFTSVLGPEAPVRWAFQRLDDLPPGFAPPPGRDRPWGTGHAVLAAMDAVGDRPFGVANADDWYGPEALRALAEFLRNAPAEEACLVGYPLAATLSPHGGVSRGRVRHDGHRVVGVEECTGLAQEGSGVRGTDANGHPTLLDPGELVSMNLWGLPPDAPALLRALFRRFLEDEGGTLDGEFLLSQALGDLAAAHALTVRLLEGGERWFGVTHPQDRPLVQARLAALHQDGTYVHHPHLRAGSVHP